MVRRVEGRLREKGKVGRVADRVVEMVEYIFDRGVEIFVEKSSKQG